MLEVETFFYSIRCSITLSWKLSTMSTSCASFETASTIETRKSIEFGHLSTQIISDLIAFPAFHQDLLTFGRFRHRRTESRGEFPHSRRLKQQQYSAIATIKNRQIPQKSNKHHLQKSLKIFKHRQFFCSKMFKNLQTFESLYGDW